MKTVLFLAFSGPYPPRDGKRQRTYALLQALTRRYKVDMIIVDHPEDYQIAVQELESENLHFFNVQTKQTLCSKTLHRLGWVFPISSNVKKIVQSRYSQVDYDFVISRYIQPMAFVPKGKRIILDLDDDFREVYLTRIAKASKWIRKVRLWQVLQLNLPYYNKLLRSADRVITVKEEALPVSFHILPNLPFQALFGDEVSFVPCTEKSLLYVGKLSYPPNAKGVAWFLENVWPRILREEPEVQLTIISTVPPQSPSLSDLIQESAHVHLLLNVPDLTSYYHRSAVIIAPVFEGGGSNIKVAEALLMGKPVVTTEFGAKGFEDFETKPFLRIASDDLNFHKNILFMLSPKVDLLQKQALAFNYSKKVFNLDRWTSRFLDIVTNE